jgi:hypothetical protein
MDWLYIMLVAGRDTLRDVLPIAIIIIGFQLGVLRRPIPNVRRVVIGFFYVTFGMGLFLLGLTEALFPLGKLMAKQLAHPEFILGTLETSGEILHWGDYKWVYLFAAVLGFSTTIAEPALLAVARKANQVSGGAIGMHGLRVAVAIGAAIGVALGCLRITTGIPLHYFIIAGYIFVIVQTVFAPRFILRR